MPEKWEADMRELNAAKYAGLAAVSWWMVTVISPSAAAEILTLDCAISGYTILCGSTLIGTR